MLRGTEAQRNFFDDAIFARMIPPDHPLVAIDQAVDFSFIHDEVKALPMGAGGDLAERLRGKGNPRGDGLRADSKTKL